MHKSFCNPWLSASLQLRHFHGEFEDGDMCKQASRRNSAAYVKCPNGRGFLTRCEDVPYAHENEKATKLQFLVDIGLKITKRFFLDNYVLDWGSIGAGF